MKEETNKHFITDCTCDSCEDERNKKTVMHTKQQEGEVRCKCGWTREILDVNVKNNQDPTCPAYADKVHRFNMTKETPDTFMESEVAKFDGVFHAYLNEQDHPKTYESCRNFLLSSLTRAKIDAVEEMIDIAQLNKDAYQGTPKGLINEGVLMFLEDFNLTLKDK